MFVEGAKLVIDSIGDQNGRGLYFTTAVAILRAAARPRHNVVDGGSVEQEAREVAAVSRGQNVVYVMPHDWASIAQFLGPMLDRVDDQNRDVQLLLVSSDVELAAALAAAAVKLTEGRNVGIIAATSPRRAARLIRLRPAQVIAATPDSIAELLKGAALKLDAVRAVAIAWLDELVAQGATTALENLMTEVPKDAGRTVVTAEISPSVEELLERYARRARRVVAPTSATDQPMPIEFVTTSAESRLGTLRRTLDSIDPASAVVFVRDRDSDVRVRDLLRSLGYGTDDAPIRAGLTAAPGTELVVLFDVPASREELREAGGAAKRVIALIQPRQLTSLRSLAAGGAVKPFTLTDSSARARDRDARLRTELRSLLEEGHFGRELIALEPLLEDYDGIEIAAAALQLAERERAKASATTSAVAPSAVAPRERSVGPMVRLFVNVGARDSARPGDLVGAITNQGGITSDDVGKVEVRESHSIVEVSPGVADSVIERVTGTTIRGRRAIVRRDEQRAPRDTERGPRAADRGARGGDRGERGAASGPRRYPPKGGGAGHAGRERTPPRRGDRE
jgi:ATP-dependent RNA helicase DeaD